VPGNWSRIAGEWPVPCSAEDRHLSTNRTQAFTQWRYGNQLLAYRHISTASGSLLVRARRRGVSQELVISDVIGLGAPERDAVATCFAAEAGLDHVLRCGPSAFGQGFLRLPGGGPVLTYRALRLCAMPPLPNWQLQMGDIELF
jgi:hypothetical protein